MPEYRHQSVLVEEVASALRLRSGGRYVDGTLGGGGHAAMILDRTSPDGWLFGCDRDGIALAAATERMADRAGRFQFRRGDFADLAEWIEPASCDGVLLDLGVSSAQLDQAGRGFSFQLDGPLDMRMDDREPRSAADWVNEAPVEELIRIFREFGEEREARRLARAIEAERRKGRFTSTRQLAALVERVTPRRGRRLHPATRVFQALRMAVNDELGSLRRGLGAAVDVLRPGGRLAVITFHSVEDRVVKLFGQKQSCGYAVLGEADVPELRRPVCPTLRWVQRKPQVPTADEIEANPRSRSARLRVLEKL